MAAAKKRDPYRTLGLKRQATKDETTAAYRRLALKYHPDRNPGDARAAERFHEVNFAYELLSDAARRARFDRTGDTEHKPDLELANIMGILAPVVETAFSEVIRSHQALKHVDIVAKIRAALVQDLECMAKQIDGIKQAKAELEEAIGRFIPPEGDANHLGELMRPRLETFERQIAGVQERIPLVKRTLEFVRGYRFRVDSMADWTNATMKSTFIPNSVETYTTKET